MFFLHLNNTRSFMLVIIQGAQCFSRRFLNDYYSDHMVVLAENKSYQCFGSLCV
jgi:hypothetical protein